MRLACIQGREALHSLSYLLVADVWDLTTGLSGLLTAERVGARHEGYDMLYSS